MFKKQALPESFVKFVEDEHFSDVDKRKWNEETRTKLLDLLKVFFLEKEVTRRERERERDSKNNLKKKSNNAVCTHLLLIKEKKRVCGAGPRKKKTWSSKNNFYF